MHAELNSLFSTHQVKSQSMKYYDEVLQYVVAAYKLISNIERTWAGALSIFVFLVLSTGSGFFGLGS